MQDHNISTKVLLAKTLRLFPQLLVFVALLALIYAVAYAASGSIAVAMATFFALTFFAAPLACSSIRANRGLRLLTRAGGKTLLFCFAWGCVVSASFVGALQLSQDMDATALDYVVAMAAAGFICAAIAVMPRSR